jgi:RNA polymerase sigma-70 factor, ECF subfamily
MVSGGIEECAEMKLRETVESARNGDEQAFAELVREFHPKVHNMAVSFTGNAETADDLCQEIFLKAYTALPGFRFKSEFGTWLYRIAINHIRDFLRKKKSLREISMESIGDLPAAFDLEKDVERRRSEAEVSALLRCALENLSPNDRIILTLRDIQGLPYEEIAHRLRLSPGTVDSRLHRARKKLRKHLSPLLREEGGRNALP